MLFGVVVLLLFSPSDVVVVPVLNRPHVSKLSTLKCAAAADSVSRNV